MSENTANAGHKNEYAEVCIGQIIATEKEIEMPPQYAYRIDFKEDNVMVIPLEENKTNNKNKENATRKRGQANQEDRNEIV